MTVLKAALRLSGAATAGALAVIDQAVKDVRIGFYDNLGATRVAQIVAFTDSDDPDNDNEITRAKANSVEIKWTRVLLLRRLPSLFIDASGARQTEWNDEAPFVAGPERLLNQEIEKLEAEINAALEELKGEADAEDPAVNVSVIGPDETPDLPGASIWPGRRRS